MIDANFYLTAHFIVCFAYPCLLCCIILRFFFCQSMAFRIPCSYETLGITLKFNACQIGQIHLKWSKCCPALPEAWAPANAGAHAEPLYIYIYICLPYVPLIRSDWGTVLRRTIVIGSRGTTQTYILPFFCSPHMIPILIRRTTTTRTRGKPKHQRTPLCLLQ